MFIQTNVLSNSFLHLFGYSIFQVETGSMSGAMEIGDLIIIKLGNSDIKPQDIVTYFEQDYFVTHRITSINGNSITTKGDANNSVDAPISKDQVIGKVIYVIDMGTVKNVITDKAVIIPAGVTLLLFIVLVTYKEKAGERNERRAKEKKEERNDEENQ